MQFFIRILIFILLLLTMAQAQWVQYQPDTPLASRPLLQDSLYHQLNFYDQAGNIAALFFDEKAFSLWTGGNFNFASGDYRTVLIPDNSNNQRYFFRLVKPLTASDIFKGYFGYQRMEERKLQWVHQNRQLETNTLVLGDSSTGDFVLNGIFWSGEWAHAFGKSWFTGAGMYYNVDRRLKQNFPKPENQHRDIHFRGGLQKNWKSLHTGISFRYFDEQEKVEISRYNLDQNLTPVLYKFRFSDLPVILLGKTSEERQIDYDGIAVDFHLLHKTLGKLTLWGGLSYSRSRGKVVDGGAQPQDQGSFKREDMGGKVDAQVLFSPAFTGRISYSYTGRDFRVEPPEFALTAIKHPYHRHRLVLSLKKGLGDRSNLFGDLLYENVFDHYQDLMTVNQYRYQYHLAGISLGWQNRITARWEYQLWGSLQYYSPHDQSRTDNRYSDFFDDLFIRTYDYLVNHNVDWGGGLQVVYHYGPVLDGEFTLCYDRYLPEDSYPENSFRQNLVLKIVLKFFII